MDLRTVKTYLISPATGKYVHRSQEVMRRLHGHGFHNVELIVSVADPSPTNSLSLTNLLIFEKELGKCRPFLIVEDDIQFAHTDYYVDIPQDAVAIHLGVSMWIYGYGYNTMNTGKHIRSITNNDIHPCPNNYKLVCIKGMTSGHAVLYLDHGYVAVLRLCIQANITTMTPHDIVLASLQHCFQNYALKNSLFYQDASLGGQERETRLVWHDDQYHHFIPDSAHPINPHQDT